MKTAKLHPILLAFPLAIRVSGALPWPQLLARSPVPSPIPAGSSAPSKLNPTIDGPVASGVTSAVINPDNTAGNTELLPEYIVTILDPNREIQVVTSTDLPSSQSPTTTSATQNIPDTTGSVHTRLESDGNPAIVPFPTSLPSVANTTLTPLTTFAPFSNATEALEPTITQTLSIPTTTIETIIRETRTLTLPWQFVSTSESAVTDTLVDTLKDSTSISISTGTAISSSNTLTLSEATVVFSSTATSTLATTFTTAGSPTGIPVTAPNSTFEMAGSGQDAFLPVGLGAPPSNITRRGGHPAPRLGIQDTTSPISTNKFYANFFLGSQTQAAFTHPYSLAWSRGSGNAQSWGMAISHVEPRQIVFGPPRQEIPGSPASYFYNPIRIQSLIMSAAELQSATVLTSDSLQAFSANIHLQPSSGSDKSITFPVVQGMGFVTGLYTNLQPAIQSSVFFRSVVAVESPRQGTFKYRTTLEDGKTWLVYATPDSGTDPNLRLVSATLLQGMPGFSGSIQIAKVPLDDESVYDNAAGAYPTSASLAGRALEDKTGSYSLTWTKGGRDADRAALVMFALPHHVESFDATTRSRLTRLQLSTTTKGMAMAVASDTWTMLERDLPVDMGFAPWRIGAGNVSALPNVARSAIQEVSEAEVSQDMMAQTNLNSMYFSGKGLSKFATIIYTMNDLTDQRGLAAAGLEKLKAAFARFADNRQQFPLFYDTEWKGVVSSASYVTGDPYMDFGNSYYNDHHFHYGYFIHAAAIIGYLDPSWLAENQDYVNMLVRDTSNPSGQDQFFPVWRAFDWYNGHSWAKGLFESTDGKDQESTSEDCMFAYALKMWGKTIGDASLEARGNLMLSVLTRTLDKYFLFKSSNTIQPAKFIGNKVTGILFENKIDHTTYFGTNLEYIQGIHMIPLMPFSAFARDQEFVKEEWETYFADGQVTQASTVQGGWRGILYANLALINPTAAYNFFSQKDFNPSWLDGGASRTWYLAYTAGLGGADRR